MHFDEAYSTQQQENSGGGDGSGGSMENGNSKSRPVGLKRHHHSCSGGCGFDLSNFGECTAIIEEESGDYGAAAVDSPPPAKQMALEKEEKEEKAEGTKEADKAGELQMVDRQTEEQEEEDEEKGGGISPPHGGKYYGFGTAAIHTGMDPERWDMNQIVPPISLSTTYKQPKPGQPIGHDYSRAGNPTRDVLEENIAALEQGRHCRIFSSGLSATAAMANWVPAGGHVILSDDGYGGTQRYFRRICNEKHGIELSFVDMTRLDRLKKALKPNTKMIWFETPSNPLLKVIDIQAVSKVVRAYNSDIVLVVDNTFMSPLFQRPLALGADAVLHSLTKYINGHSDVVMGAVVTNSKRLNEHLFFQQLAVGAVPSSFDSYLVIRGIKTLHLRMRQHMENALAIAKWLEADQRVEKVLYPELPSHPQHAVHKRQASGMSGMISFYLRGGLQQSEQFLASLKIFLLAESLGGYESLAELPSIMTHASVPPAMRRQLGIEDNLIRLSVGCEDKEDLIRDLDAALKAATSLSH